MLFSVKPQHDSAVKGRGYMYTYGSMIFDYDFHSHAYDLMRSKSLSWYYGLYLGHTIVCWAWISWFETTNSGCTQEMRICSIPIGVWDTEPWPYQGKATTMYSPNGQLPSYFFSDFPFSLKSQRTKFQFVFIYFY